MCECQHECSKEEFIYGIDEIPCWFKKYKYTEVGFGNFHVCYLYINLSVEFLNQRAHVLSDKLNLGLVFWLCERK